MTAPVAFFIFNRPDCTRRVFEAIRQARPSRLYVVADGPRSHVASDAENCAAARGVVERVDWPCNVRVLFAEQNLGCGHRIASGIDWVFAQEDEAIFLEDDCLPAVEFFPFCGELLQRYRYESRVGQICGCTFIGERVSRPESYLFSRYGPVWGWASWRRAWQHYDFAMSRWPDIQDSPAWRRIVPSTGERALRRKIYDDIQAGRLDTWDYQWGFAKMINGLLCAIPCTNLIANIGFGPGATHTSETAAGLRHRGMSFPLVHPAVARDAAYDRIYSRTIAPGLLRRAWRRLWCRLSR